MKFNSWMLKDRIINNIEASLSPTTSRELTLQGIRLYDAKIKCNPCYAYLVPKCAHPCLVQENIDTPLSFIFITDKCLENIPKQWSVMQLYTKKSLSNVFQLLVNAVMELQNWYDDFIQSVLCQKDLQLQLDLAAYYLKNPVAIFDMSTVLITWAGKLPEQVTDPVWSNVLNQGYNTLESFPEDIRNQLANEIGSRTIHIIPDLAQKDVQHNMMLTLYHDHMPIAWIAMNELNAPFDYAELSFMQLIKSVLEKSPVLLRNLVLSENHSSKIFQRLILGVPCEPLQIQIFLHEHNLHPADSFRLYLFQFLQKEKMHEESYHSYMALISKYVPEMILFYYNHSILGIRKNVSYTSKDILSLFSEIKLRTGILIGISMPFIDYNNLNHAYMQASAAWKYTDDKQYLIYYEDICEQFFIDALKSAYPISYCHSRSHSF